MKEIVELMQAYEVANSVNVFLRYDTDNHWKIINFWTLDVIKTGYTEEMLIKYLSQT